MKSGTTMKTGHAMKAASTSGVRHGASQKNHSAGRNAAGVFGPGAGKSTLAPIKGRDGGGLK